MDKYVNATQIQRSLERAARKPGKPEITQHIMKLVCQFFEALDGEEVRPVKRAHWIRKRQMVKISDDWEGVPLSYICSSCGHEEQEEHEFCVCGAWMRDDVH